MNRKTPSWLALVLITWLPNQSQAQEDQDLNNRAEAEPIPGGLIEGMIDGQRVTCPLLKTDMQAQIRSDAATVRLVQTFENPNTKAMHARYVFPLPPNAAVYAMRLHIGKRVIEGEIHEKQKAVEIYEQAKAEGKQASMLTQHRPNVFVQQVANLMPGERIRVELEYAHAIPKRDGAFHFHFPMVVGPRYVPAARAKEGEPEALEVGQWNLPASAPVALPDTIDPDRVAIQLHLDAGLPVQWIDSPSHVIDVHDRGINARWIRLAAGRTIDNQDFSLRFGLAGKAVAAGVSTWAKDGQGVLSLLIEPPVKAKPAQISRREMVFVLDCSGSMSGVPMDTSKRFMRQALSRLRLDDHFRIIRFSHRASAFAERPVKASAANIQRGLAYLNQLRGQGGTEMTTGIRAALDPAVPTGSMRIVVFLTDGYIGNEADVTRLIQQRRGEARLFSFGIGNAVNRYLLSEMARAGRGVARFVRPDQDPEQEADRLAKRLQAPLLTDVEIDWGDAPVSQPTPKILPDLFMGERLRVLARFDKPGEYTITVRGKMAGKQISLPLLIKLPEIDPDGQALDVLWARSQVEDRMLAYLDPSIAQSTRETLRKEVIELGLEHKLVTQWTAFVAVAKEIVNPGGQADPADVAVAQVQGVSKNAYPLGTPIQKGSGSFFGSSAPEPASWAAIILLLLLSMVWLRR